MTYVTYTVREASLRRCDARFFANHVYFITSAPAIMVAPLKVCVCLATLIIIAAISRSLHTSDDADRSTLQAEGRDLMALSPLTLTVELSTLLAGPMEGRRTRPTAEPSTLPVGLMEGAILATAAALTGSTVEPSTLPVGPMRGAILATAKAPTDLTAEPSTLPVEGAILVTAEVPTDLNAEPSMLPAGPMEGAILVTAEARTDSTMEPKSLSGRRNTAILERNWTI